MDSDEGVPPSGGTDSTPQRLAPLTVTADAGLGWLELYLGCPYRQHFRA